MSACCKNTKRPDEEKRKIISRVNRISGQINGIKNMIEDDKYCNDILIQIVAAQKSLKSLANLMFENHVYRCIASSINDEEVVDELTSLFARFSD